MVKRDLEGLLELRNKQNDMVNVGGSATVAEPPNQPYLNLLYLCAT